MKLQYYLSHAKPQRRKGNDYSINYLGALASLRENIQFLPLIRLAAFLATGRTDT